VVAWQEVQYTLPFAVVSQLAQSGSAIVQSVQLSFFLLLKNIIQSISLNFLFIFENKNIKAI
jgi:hypothetical protein